MRVLLGKKSPTLGCNAVEHLTGRHVITTKTSGHVDAVLRPLLRGIAASVPIRANLATSPPRICRMSIYLKLSSLRRCPICRLVLSVRLSIPRVHSSTQPSSNTSYSSLRTLYCTRTYTVLYTNTTTLTLLFAFEHDLISCKICWYMTNYYLARSGGSPVSITRGKQAKDVWHTGVKWDTS